MSLQDFRVPLHAEVVEQPRRGADAVRELAVAICSR
jgi:hypothetical protein